MKTKNKRLKDEANNIAYYQKSDGNWMDRNYCTKAHKVLDRIRWAREWIHKLGSKYHFDCGCKDGYLNLTLGSEGVNCIGIDASSDAIEEAILRAFEFKLNAHVLFFNTRIENYENKMKFDTATLLEVIEHVVDPVIILKKLSKLAKYVLISTPDAKGRHGMIDSEQNEEHIRLYTKKELEDLVRQFGEVIEIVENDDQLYVILKINGN